MHFATTLAFPTLKKAVIYKRFIDDIIFIAIGENSRQNIIKAIENSLGKVGLHMTTKLFSTKCSDQQGEFLDVLTSTHRTRHLNLSGVIMSKKLSLTGLL